MMTFGEKVKRVREIKLFSQKDLADALGTAEISILRWENNQAAPRWGTQRKFFEYCRLNGITFNGENDNED